MCVLLFPDAILTPHSLHAATARQRRLPGSPRREAPLRLQVPDEAAAAGGERARAHARPHDRLGVRGAPHADTQLLGEPEALQARHPKVSVELTLRLFGE